jgi:hypothetical protein
MLHQISGKLFRALWAFSRNTHVVVFILLQNLMGDIMGQSSMNVNTAFAALTVSEELADFQLSRYRDSECEEYSWSS